MKKILIAMAIAATLVAISATAEEDRFAERLALDKDVPHEVARSGKNPIAEKYKTLVMRVGWPKNSTPKKCPQQEAISP